MTAVVDILPILADNQARVKNVFKKELISVFKPFDLIQAFYVSSMYRVRNGFILPNSFFYIIVSGIWSLLLLTSYFFLLFKYVLTDEMEGFNFIKCSSNIPTFLVYCFGNVTKYWTNVVQRQNNVKFAMSIQNICEMLKVNGNTLKNFTLLNWIYTGALIGFRIFWIINLNMAFSLVFKFNENMVHLFYVIFDVTILYFARLMKLISEPLRIWIDDARKTKCVADVDNELYWNEKFRVYLEIVETYEIVEKSSQKLILYYCIDTFTNGVISVWLRVELSKVLGASLVKLALSLLSLLWLAKNMILIIALCMECERFYSIMAEVRSTCILLTTSEACPEAQKRVCKNIQRDQTASFKKMSACGLFFINGELPLLLSSLLTTYIIVVLQLEFL